MAARVYVVAHQCLYTGTEALGPCVVDVDVSSGIITSVTPLRNHTTVGRDGIAVLEASIVCPGLIDIHTHGRGGCREVTEYWLQPEYSCRRAAEGGTTSLLATFTMPSGDAARANTRAVVESLSQARGKTWESGGAVIEGVHMEGPFITDLGGMAHSDRNIPLEELCDMLDGDPPLVRIMTISPSFAVKSGFRPLDALLDRGIRIALGHDTHATEEQIVSCLRRATARGVACHFTHTFNVMSFHHRNVGLANFALARYPLPALPFYDGLTIEPTMELVGDTFHVHPLTLQLAVHVKHPSTIAFVTDSTAESTPGREFTHGGFAMRVAADGTQVEVTGSTMPRGGHSEIARGQLAGSCVTQSEILRTLVNILHVPPSDAVCMLTTAPATIAGLERKIGGVMPGLCADLLLLSSEWDVELVMVRGVPLVSHIE